MIETTTTFKDLGLGDKVLKALEDMGFEEPSPIQERTIPLLLQGRDVIGQAQTGTGKTAAFGAPIVERHDLRLRGVQALVLTPTRELAIQVAEEVAKIGKYARLKTIAIYGGQSIDRQIRSLRYGVDVVIGTPGRILDHLGRGTLKLDQIRTFVLDEADEMLDMGFIEDIEEILKATPETRQTLLFSATFPDEIRRLAQRYMRTPEHVTVSPQHVTVPQIEQVFYEVKPAFKVEALCRIVDVENIERGICFCRTKKGVDELTEGLQTRGYLAEGIHGDMNQAQRNRVMGKFREGHIELLIATDVAARGLDIPDVTHVVNYDIPQDPEGYVHRIGRTGRAGKSGTAITLIGPREFLQLRQIERAIRQRINKRPLPTVADVAERQRELLRERLVKVMEQGQLGFYRELADELLNEYSAEDLLAAALKMLAGEEKGAVAPDEDFGDTGAEAGMVRLFLNVGRQQGVMPADVVRTIAQSANIPGSAVGLINIYDRFTFVEVPKEMATQVMRGLQDATIKGRSVNVEPARRR
jgi:ATP-dependent RNA helicase DeaD